MKLYLSQNIKQLRVQSGMTQEQLADRVGFSHKAVSRWENGISYPDIETLPVLAEIFGVTLDELLGATHEREKEDKNEYYERLSHTAQEDEYTEILCEMRKKYPHDAGVLSTYQRWLHRTHAPVSEIRRATQELLAFDEKTFCREAKLEAAARLYDAEEEDKTDAVLSNFPENPLFDRRYLSMSRHSYRGEWKKYDLSREAYLLYGLGIFLMSDVLSCRCCAHDGSKGEAKRTASIEETRLDVINTLTKTLGQNPVSGDGEPDLWFSYRIHSGLRLSCALAGLGKTDESLGILEDVAQLFQRFWSIPEGTELSFRTEALPTVRLSPVFFSISFNGDYFKREKKHIACSLDGFTGTYGNVSKESLDVFFAADVVDNILYADSFLTFDRGEGWEWFDSVRKSKRYKSCVEKMKESCRFSNFPHLLRAT